MNSEREAYSSAATREFRGIVFVAAGAVLAFVGACVAHEVAGHAGACLIGGGTVRQVSSSLFACHPGTLLADLGGPGANFMIGLVSLLLLQGQQRGTTPHLVLTLSAAFNMFWVVGELLMSAVMARDDFAYAARMFGAAQIPSLDYFWRSRDWFGDNDVPSGRSPRLTSKRATVGLLGDWCSRLRVRSILRGPNQAGVA